MIILHQIALGPARKPYQIVVINPDLQIRGRLGGNPDPEIRGEPQSQKKNLFGLKIIREAGGPSH